MRHEHPSGAIWLLAADVNHRGHAIVYRIAQVAIVLCDPGIEYPNGIVNNEERQIGLTARVELRSGLASILITRSCAVRRAGQLRFGRRH